MPDRIQEGIHFRRGETPQPHFSIAFLDVVGTADRSKVRSCLEFVWMRIQELKSGLVADLPGQQVDPQSLTAAIGYGAKLFELEGLGLKERKPLALKPFLLPLAAGGGPISNGAGIHYETSVTTNPGSSAISILFTANSALAVRRALVETWKALADHLQATEEDEAIIAMVASYTGFGREDRRSWIDFFDGTSNMRSDERLKAIQIEKKGEVSAASWVEEGTYLCFMRLAVDLNAWRSHPRSTQEIMVGRDKLSGCPLVAAAGGQSIPRAGCPFATGGNVEDGQNEAFREAPRPPGNQALKFSHIHRANLGRGATPVRLVFRQGYEFYDGTDAQGNPDLGLNFVSFQESPERVIGMLKLDDWLGGVNFGGDPNNQPAGLDALIRARAACFHVLPPRPVNSDELPGVEIFTP